ncbi:tubulin---tyrosine ligase, partial [Phenoliferia sp. Uapishka_3]
MTMSKRQRVALVQYPASQSFVLDSLLPALAKELPDWRVLTTRDAATLEVDLQWSDYDEVDWDAGLGEGRMVNSYLIRKGLIRKNHLAHTLALYLSKNPTSPLRSATPKTFIFNLSFPDELDELLCDDLYELQESFQSENDHWWILKAALADKGNGIRLFKDREGLEAIFEEFQPESDDEEDDEDEGDLGELARGIQGAYGLATRVDSSQMQEWVIQEYISSPLLLSSPLSSNFPPRKFHLRVYAVAVGQLSLYVHHPFLALFAPSPYLHPSSTTSGDPIDLSSHLTNTCLQAENGMEEEGIVVELFQEMEEWIISSAVGKDEKFGADRVKAVEGKVEEILGETFKAGVGAGSAFQTLPNCFEIFGCDLLVDDALNVTLLEINACPDFSQTGLALQSVINNLFEETLKVAVVPFFGKIDDGGDAELDGQFDQLGITEGKNGTGNLRKVMEMQVRGGGMGASR